MKKTVLPFLIFSFVFILIFAILSMGLKLSADPAEYIIQSVRHLFWEKSAVSFAAGLIAGVVTVIIPKRKDRM